MSKMNEENEPIIETEVVVDTVTGISLQDYGIALAIFVLFLVFRKLFTRYLFKLIVRLVNKSPTDLFYNILLAYEKPLRAFFAFIGIFASLTYLPLPEEFNEVMMDVFRTIIIVLIAWGLYNMSAASSKLFTRIGRKMDIELDEILLPFLSKLLRFAIVAMTISIIASEWGYDVSGFVAGLGLGGLAFALAAQNTISNFFGGVVIITEKPFTIGDWISSPSVEGVVEDITFRSTKIRTFAHSLVTVPNSTLANEPIQNWSQMGKRQITFKLGVTYSTSRQQLETCVKRIKHLLHNHEEVDQELIMVRFDEFSDSSLNIFLYFFTKTTDWEEHLEAKENINLEIMKILEEEGVQVAFPSRSLYFENDEGKSKGEKIDYTDD